MRAGSIVATQDGLVPRRHCELKYEVVNSTSNEKLRESLQVVNDKVVFLSNDGGSS